MFNEQKNKVMVSIIVPFYNVQNYILETLRSIEGQLFRDFEVILIDDESTDNSLQLVEKYLSKCCFRSILISQRNNGVSAARNKGLLHASGDFIVFVDADDILSPYYIKQMYEHINRNNIQMVICGFETFRDDSILKFEHSAEKAKLKNSLAVMNDFLLGIIKISAWSIMVKRELIGKYNIQFAEGYRYSEDIHFVWRVLAHIDVVGIDPAPLYYYRWRSGSAMGKFGEYRLDGMYLMLDLEEYFQKYCGIFASEFLKYGVARWVWATLWQAACALPYNDFKDICIKCNATEMMQKLKIFPDHRVSKSASLFVFSHYIYYLLVRVVAQIKGTNRF